MKNQMENEMNDEMEGLSNCCGAEIIWTDICSDCKEHCDVCENED